jgi:hypothetical protein
MIGYHLDGRELTLCDVAEGAPDKLLDTSLLGSIDKVLALLKLELVVHLLPVIRDSVDCCGAGHGFDQRCLVVNVGLRELLDCARHIWGSRSPTLTTSAP